MKHSNTLTGDACRQEQGPGHRLTRRFIHAMMFLLTAGCWPALAQDAGAEMATTEDFSTEFVLPGKRLRHYSHAATLWWAIFNNPNACLSNPLGLEKCGAVDIFGQAYLDSVAAGNPDPSLIQPNIASGVAVLYATGGLSDPRNGRIRLAASIYRSPFEHLDLAGAQIVDPLGLGLGFVNYSSEVHLIVRDHGRQRRAGMVTQITNFLEPYCSDPLLGWEGGRNTCADIQAAVFAVDEDGKDAVFRLSDGQSLSYGSAYLFRQGDMLQAVVDTRIPDRRHDVVIQ